VSDDLVHPPPELLSLHRDRLLTSDQGRQVQAHVAGCGQCRAELDALDAAVRRLQDVGRQQVPMPPDVAVRIAAAIAAEASERPPTTRLQPAGDPRSGPSYRDQAASRHRRRSRVLVAAAMVAVLAAGGVAANLAINRGGGLAPAARNAASTAIGPSRPHGSSRVGGSNVEAKARSSGSPRVTSVLAIDRGNFETVAPLAVTTDEHAGRPPVRCFRAAVTGYHPRTWLSATVEWHGERAWLLFDPRHSRGVVVDCSAHPRSMYRHQF
jgi:hypothetical protein